MKLQAIFRLWGLTSDNVKPLVNEVIANGDKAAHSINDFQSLWYANVVDEISIQYPLLAQGEITRKSSHRLLQTLHRKADNYMISAASAGHTFF